jgi:sugar O-acyltransferase (sialic acid O-acetyltransferase NeuD family)
MEDVVIIGAGGFGREILDVFEAVNQQEKRYNVLGFIVDPQYAPAEKIINGQPILGGFEWLETNKKVLAICGLGAPEARQKMIKRAEIIGILFCTVIHPSAILTRWVKIGAGTVITAGCILTNQIIIGNHVHINLDCTLGHDVVVEDFVTLSPGVHVSGNVTLKEGSYIGTGANIIEKKTIGKWSVVGAGSTIVDDVPDNTTVVGVPGKIIKEREIDWQLK